MKKQIQLVFTSYHESKVKTALKVIEKCSKEFSITTDDPIKEKGPLDFQPNLRGCDKKDLKICSLFIRGTLANAKKLVKIETPLGVQIDLLPQSV